MKEIIVQLSAYHTWANQLIIDTILGLPEDSLKQEVESSFKSLHATLLHMWDAESIWWQRLKLNEQIKIPSHEFKGSTKEIAAQLLQQNKQWQQWVAAAKEHMLQHEFKYQNSKREAFKQPVYQMLVHLFNHGTYHRGQLVNMLRQLGVSKIPQTDFIVWSRGRRSS